MEQSLLYQKPGSNIHPYSRKGNTRRNNFGDVNKFEGKDLLKIFYSNDINLGKTDLKENVQYSMYKKK